MNLVNSDAEFIIDKLIDEDVVFPSQREEEVRLFQEALNQSQAKIFYYWFGRPIIGFKWLMMKKDGQDWLFLDRLFIDKEFRHFSALYFLGSHLPKHDVLYWLSNKKDKYIYRRKAHHG